jgi:hypothetical protein
MFGIAPMTLTSKSQAAQIADSNMGLTNEIRTEAEPFPTTEQYEAQPEPEPEPKPEAPKPKSWEELSEDLCNPDRLSLMKSLNSEVRYIWFLSNCLRREISQAQFDQKKKLFLDLHFCKFNAGHLDYSKWTVNKRIYFAKWLLAAVAAKEYRPSKDFAQEWKKADFADKTHEQVIELQLKPEFDFPPLPKAEEKKTPVPLPVEVKYILGSRIAFDDEKDEEQAPLLEESAKELPLDISGDDEDEDHNEDNEDTDDDYDSWKTKE